MATLPKWRIAQVFRLFRVLPGTVATAAPQNRRPSRLVRGRRVLHACAEEPDGKKNRGDASEMPLRSVSSPMFVSPAWKLDSGGARRQSRLRRDSDVAHAPCRAWPPSVLMGGNRRETIGGHSPKNGAALGPSALLCFFRMGGQLRRKNNPGDTASVKRGRLASPLSVFFRPARSTPAGTYP